LYPNIIEWNFHPTAHGKGPADMHIAHAKRICKKHKNKEQIFDALEDYTRIIDDLEDTTVTDISAHLEQAVELRAQSALKDTKSFHQFKFEAEGVIRCKYRSSDQESNEV
jgi:hypothetical protein